MPESIQTQTIEIIDALVRENDRRVQEAYEKVVNLSRENGRLLQARKQIQMDVAAPSQGLPEGLFFFPQIYLESVESDLRWVPIKPPEKVPVSIPVSQKRNGRKALGRTLADIEARR